MLSSFVSRKIFYINHKREREGGRVWKVTESFKMQLWIGIVHVETNKQAYSNFLDFIKKIEKKENGVILN